MNSTIIDVLCDVLGDPELSDFSVPLMDMGLDSLSAVEFRNRVQASFDGLHLASTAPGRPSKDLFHVRFEWFSMVFSWFSSFSIDLHQISNGFCEKALGPVFYR